MRLSLILLSAFLSLLLLGIVLAGTTAAGIVDSATADFTVNSTLDAVDVNPGDGLCQTAVGTCTLRAAIQETNALPGEDTIMLPAGQYNRTLAGVGEDQAATGDLDISDSLNIIGDDPLTTIIDGNQLDRVIEITATASVTVTITNVTVRDGLLSSGYPGGGGLRNGVNSHLILSNTMILDNVAYRAGGGLENVGLLELSNSTIAGNTNGNPTGFGGGISTDGEGKTLVKDSMITANEARYGGGTYTWYNATMTVTGSLFSSNSGAAVYVQGTVFIFDSEMFNNLPFPAPVEVGTIRVDGIGKLFVEGSTIGNSGETGIINYNRAVISDSIIINNNGSGIFTDNYLEIHNSLVMSNTGSGIFGGAGSGGGQVFVTGSIIRNNQTTQQYGTASSGGGIYNGRFTRLTVISSTIEGNEASLGSGGGIFSQGPITVTGSLIENNSAYRDGGGLYLADSGSKIGQLGFLRESVIQNNQAGEEGGGLFFRGDNGFHISSSTIYSNQAILGGGGLYLDGSVIMTNTTIGRNESSLAGGGIYQYPYSSESVELNNVTLYQNDAPDGSTLSGIILTLVNSIVAGDAGNNCEGTITSLGHNLDSGDSCGFNQSGDLSNIIPLFGPLQNNGGPTPTYALLPGSPAVDGGANGSCEDDDQRGFSRPVDGDGNGSAICDMGAYEYGAAPVPEMILYDISVPEGDAGTTTAVFTLTLSKAAGQPITVTFTTADGSAIAGLDYVATAGVATINPGQTWITIPVTILGDTVGDYNEVFYLIVSQPSLGYLIKPVGVCTIEDNEPVIYLPLIMKAP